MAEAFRCDRCGELFPGMPELIPRLMGYGCEEPLLLQVQIERHAFKTGVLEWRLKCELCRDCQAAILDETSQKLREEQRVVRSRLAAIAAKEEPMARNSKRQEL